MESASSLTERIREGDNTSDDRYLIECIDEIFGPNFDIYLKNFNKK